MGQNMKAPDKIYINITPLGVDYSIVPIPDFGGVEYIRKDALLEWWKNKFAKSPIPGKTITKYLTDFLESL